MSNVTSETHRGNDIEIIVDGAFSGVPMNMNGVRGSIQIWGRINGQSADKCDSRGQRTEVVRVTG